MFSSRHNQYLQRMEHKKKAFNSRLPPPEGSKKASATAAPTPVEYKSVLTDILANPDGTIKTGLSVAELKMHMSEKIKRKEIVQQVAVVEPATIKPKNESKPKKVVKVIQ